MAVGQQAPAGHRPGPAAGRRWRDHAVCRRTDPELFFPVAERGPQRDAEEALAKAVCAGCPVRAACLAWALGALPYGVAGGLSEDERRAVRRAHDGRRRAHDGRGGGRVGAPCPPAGESESARTGSRAQRRSAAAELAAGGRARSAVAAEFGVTERTVGRWIAAVAASGHTGARS